MGGFLPVRFRPQCAGTERAACGLVGWFSAATAKIAGQCARWASGARRHVAPERTPLLRLEEKAAAGKQ
jgi:hypothetical protein